MKYYIRKKEPLAEQYNGYAITKISSNSIEENSPKETFSYRSVNISFEKDNVSIQNIFGESTIIVPLNEGLILVDGGEKSKKLFPYEWEKISNISNITFFGKVNAYGLFVNNDEKVCLETFSLKQEATRIPTQSKKVVIYCHGEYAILSFEGDRIMLKNGEELVCSFEDSKSKEISLMGDGKIIVSQFFQETTPPEESTIPKARPTLQDFLLGLKLSTLRFKGSKRLLRQTNREYFDEALEKAIARLERSLITFIICLLGICAISFPLIAFDKDTIVLPAIIIWIFIDIFVISPLIYMVFLPKPIKSHIKNINDLNSEEKKVYEKRKKENYIVDKILKKYKISGRNKYKK